MRQSLLTLLFATAAVAAAPATAQTDTLTPRVNKLEKEMRAVQRKVFPDGGTILEPEIAPQATPQDAPGSPASSPLADLSARVSSLESQLATITGQNEENSYKIRQLEEQVKKLSADNDARLKALETPAAAVGAAPVAAANPPPVAAGGAAPPPARPTNPVTNPPKTAARAAAVAAVERPASGDPAEDSYIYGYRLWQAKLYPEAETEFKALVAKYPDHKRASFAQNLLGRSYLDEGKPALASVAFYDNYQKMPRGERAPESLYWLGVSLTRLKKPADACKVYDEFGDVYGATAPASLKTQVAEGRKAAKCP